MRKFTTLAAIAAVSLALGACSKPAEPAADANMTEEVPANDAGMANDAATMEATPAMDANAAADNAAVGNNAAEGDKASSGGQSPG